LICERFKTDIELQLETAFVSKSWLMTVFETETCTETCKELDGWGVWQKECFLCEVRKGLPKDL